MLVSLAYFKYLWSSSNQHGVHSPFVFHLLTKALYQKKALPSFPILPQWLKDHNITNRRKFKIINRSLHYFNNKEFSTLHTAEYTVDQTNLISLEDFEPLEVENAILEKNFIIVDHIDEYPEKWKEICASDRVTVSIDFYNIGFLFNKPRQRKENFKIRI